MTVAVRLLVPWFGPWPHYLPLFLRSLRDQDGVELTFVSDQPPPRDLPPNVQHHRMTLGEVLDRFSRAIGLKVPKCSPHKLCDLKPFTGLAFPDLLDGARFWGYCDVDLVFGRLGQLVATTEGDIADVIAAWVHPVGHLTLVRNVDWVNRWPLRIPDLEKRLALPGITFLDEGAMGELLCLDGAPRFLGSQPLETEWALDRAFLGLSIRHNGRLADCPLREPFVVTFDRGRVVVESSDRSIEVAYFHFMGRKPMRFFRELSTDGPLDSFSFSSLGFHRAIISPRNLASPSLRLLRGAVVAHQAIRSKVGRLLPRRLKAAFRKTEAWLLD